MNREILFKGLRADGKGWVEGVPYFLNIKEDEPEDCVHKACIIKWVDWDGTCGFMSPNNNAFVEVIPETVCQFTGGIGKNKVKIFNSDLIAYRGEIYEVRYISFEFRLFSIDDVKTSIPMLEDLCSLYEVIGNIHNQKQ